jgi:hypothetical protein
MRSLCFLLVLLAWIAPFVCAQASNSITVPPDGFQVTAGQQITIEWTNPSLTYEKACRNVLERIADRPLTAPSPFNSSLHLAVVAL